MNLTSTAMDIIVDIGFSDIIMEEFYPSIKNHNLIYRYLITDGDSIVIKKN